ncbi:MAG: magnesium chelatase subunit D [Candidatus Magnetoglobus multicellularis str. Araruama]|uniref:Mg-protoporphyrin IX chelatase n=1 Tax=Candidatus Magnetoglobus multicellularis str. Araruama TaxID=890399 RepID=A0A1V1PCW1_9BACT|nr:MAG: magnesium chelatase subunit D [Candidatus Magnetoglobus multicellularis str. Araruama]
MKHIYTFPFTAIIGQESMKLCLILNAINQRIGGVLIRGEKGTAKSTSVRALSDLLPEIRVIDGCSYSCNPDKYEDLCKNCINLPRPFKVKNKQQKVITLPLNATEDRVAGGIDFNKAVKIGKRMFKPGVLADANRGILYVDEVNLLDDHIVDIILDAAASGENLIEREGISFHHPSRFILVGTMNPEEGDLRPQLLDRFGLCVEVISEKDPEARISMMELREDFDKSPVEFNDRFAAENNKITQRIESAQKMLPKVHLPKSLRLLISEICTTNNVAGHRADLIIEQAARAHAAWFQRLEVSVEDIQKVSQFVLLHRKREASPPPPTEPPPEMVDQDQDNSQTEDQNESQQQENQKEQQPASSSSDDQTDEIQPSEQESNEQESQTNQKNNALEEIFDVGETFKVKKISTPKDRIFRRGSGRRSRTRISQKQGRYVKSTCNNTKNGISPDIALDATLRAAAPYQIHRERNGLAVSLKPEDIQEKIREKRIGNFLLFVVDASGSMGARGRMAASKGAIMSLLLDAYQKRDKVAMLSFRKEDAFVNLPPTSSIELAANLLKEMPVGGRTPLSAGLARCYEMIRNYLLKEPAGRPIVLIITDGKSNVAIGNQKPIDEALLFAKRMGADERIQYIVIDTEQEGLVQFKIAEKLAIAAGAAYLKIDDLKAETLLSVIKGT